MSALHLTLEQFKYNTWKTKFKGGRGHLLNAFPRPENKGGQEPPDPHMIYATVDVGNALL